MMAPRPAWRPAFPDSKDVRFQDLALSLSRTTLTSLPWSTRRNMLTTLTLDTSVHRALQILTNNNIHSAPVFDEFGKFYGFTDMQQERRAFVLSRTLLAFSFSGVHFPLLSSVFCLS